MTASPSFYAKLLEYLVTLQQRSKWTKQKPNIKIGDMVIVHEDIIPPSKWNLERSYNCSTWKITSCTFCIQIETTAGNITHPVVKVSVPPYNGDI